MPYDLWQQIQLTVVGEGSYWNPHSIGRYAIVHSTPFCSKFVSASCYIRTSGVSSPLVKLACCSEHRAREGAGCGSLFFRANFSAKVENARVFLYSTQTQA